MAVHYKITSHDLKESACLRKKEREGGFRFTSFPSFGKFLSCLGVSFVTNERLLLRQHSHKELFKK